MNNNSSPSYALKRSPSEESFSGKSTMFIPVKMPHINPKTMGIEYRQDVVDDAQYIKKIFDTNTYEINRDGLVEFYSDVYYIMDTKEASDKRNFGTIMGMTSFGILGFAAFGITLVGGLAGIIFGGAVGRMVAAKLASLRRKKEVITQEDLYLMKAKCMVELASKQKKRARFDLNKFRLSLEKVIEESSLTLELSLFQKPKLANDIRFQLRNLLMDRQIQLAILLSYRLLKTYLQRNDMENPVHLEKAARKVYGILIPYVKFIELGPEIPPEAREEPSLAAYFKLKSFINKQEIIDLTARFPEYQLSAESLETFRTFLRQEVDIIEPMKRAMTQNNKQATEQVALHNPRSSKLNAENPQLEMQEKAPNDDDSISCPSMKNSQCEDLGEGVTAYNADLYVSGALKRTGYTPAVSHNNLVNPRDVNINLNHGHWVRLPSITKPLMRGESHDASPAHHNQHAEETKGDGQNLQPKDYARLGTKSIEHSQSQAGEDKSQLISLGRGDNADSPMSKMRRQQSRQQSMVNTPKNQDSSPNRKSAREESKILGNSVGDNATNKVIFDKVMSIAYDNVSKWEKVLHNDKMRVDKIKPEGSPVVLIRAWANIDGYSAEEVFEQIYNAEKRSKWDSVLAGMSVLEHVDENTSIIHFIVKAPIGVSDRDFVQRRIFQRDYPQKGTITMGFQSFAHPKMPPVKGRIRAETHIAGYILRPSDKDPNSSELCLVTQVDIKGAIPKVIVNMAAGKSPIEWINKLVKACEKERQTTKKK